jgi:hypothetical protein
MSSVALLVLTRNAKILFPSTLELQPAKSRIGASNENYYKTKDVTVTLSLFAQVYITTPLLSVAVI